MLVALALTLAVDGATLSRVGAVHRPQGFRCTDLAIAPELEMGQGPDACPAALRPTRGMDLSQLPVLAGSVATTIFVGSYLPMLVKAIRTRDLSSYSRSSLVLANVGNLVQTAYVVTLPVGPIWGLHGFYLLATVVMLLLHLRHAPDGPPPPGDEGDPASRWTGRAVLDLVRAEDIGEHVLLASDLAGDPECERWSKEHRPRGGRHQRHAEVAQAPRRVHRVTGDPVRAGGDESTRVREVHICGRPHRARRQGRTSEQEGAAHTATAAKPERHRMALFRAQCERDVHQIGLGNRNVGPTPRQWDALPPCRHRLVRGHPPTVGRTGHPMTWWRTPSPPRHRWVSSPMRAPRPDS